MHKPVSTKLLIKASLLIAATCSTGNASVAQTQLQDYEAVKAAIWAMEQSTFAARAQGDAVAERKTHSPYYRLFPVGWGRAVPLTPVKGKKGRLALNFVNLAYNGGTAVLMFKAHRTADPDGTTVDAYYEVTDIWSKANGKWRLLASNPQAVEPPGQ